MKPLPEIRRARFLELVRQIGGQSKVAERLDDTRSMKSRMVQVGQWMSDPEKTAQARNMGHASARMLEGLFGLPKGWMDADPDSLSARDERVRNSLPPESLAARLDAVILSEALGVLMAIEGEKPYPSPQNAEVLKAVYAEIEAGGNPLNITARYVNDRAQGATHAQKQSRSGKGP